MHRSDTDSKIQVAELLEAGRQLEGQRTVSSKHSLAVNRAAYSANATSVTRTPDSIKYRFGMDDDASVLLL